MRKGSLTERVGDWGVGARRRVLVKPEGVGQVLVFWEWMREGRAMRDRRRVVRRDMIEGRLRRGGACWKEGQGLKFLYVDACWHLVTSMPTSSVALRSEVRGFRCGWLHGQAILHGKQRG